MALQAVTNKGASTIEAALSMSLVLAAVAGVLLLLYLGFAKSWITVQSEQALLCASEGQRNCERKFQMKAKTFLPWGQIYGSILKQGDQQWTIHSQWQGLGFKLKSQRRLDLQSVARKKALPP